MTEESTNSGSQCIRCDEVTAESYPEYDGSFKLLTYNQENGALPICNDCFDEVEDRDLWR